MQIPLFHLVQKLRTPLKGEGLDAVLARGASGSLVVNVSGTGIAFLLQVLLARLLGVDSYGVFIYAFTWMQVLALLALVGGEQTLVRYLATYRAQAAFGHMRGLLWVGHLAVLAVAVAFGAVGGVVVSGLEERLSVELLWTFYISFATLPFLVLTGISRGALRGLKRPTLALLPESILRPLLFLALAALGFWALGMARTAPLAMGMYLAAAVAAVGLGLFWLRRELPVEVGHTPPLFTPRQWLAMAVPALIMSGMNMLLKQTDVIMIGALIGTDLAGIYSAAARASELVTFGLMSVNAMLAPMVAELHSEGRHADLQRVVTLAARGGFVFMALVAVALVLLGEWVLGLFGSAFEAGYAPMLVLIAGQIVSAIAGSVGLLLFMTGYQKDAAATLVGAVAVNLALNYVFIQAWGWMGAAGATAASTALWNLIMLLMVRRKLNVDPTVMGAGPNRFDRKSG